MTAPTPDLRGYDLILANSSAGKDSQAALEVVATAAQDAGVTDRLVVVHAGLGRVEWPGTRELAAEHAAHYGLSFEVVRREIIDPTTGERRPQDLLEHIEARGKWPDAARRYCSVICTIFHWLIMAPLPCVEPRMSRGRQPIQSPIPSQQVSMCRRMFAPARTSARSATAIIRLMPPPLSN
jgi:hypothetical protein